jgi:hypothetical protein
MTKKAETAAVTIRKGAVALVREIAAEGCSRQAGVVV